MSTIQTGRHTVTVVSAEVGESKEKGTPGVFFTFRDAGGDEINGTLWLTEKTMERSTNTLREAFGFNDDFATMAEQTVGKECSITVEMEEDSRDSTKSWPRVKWINPAKAPSSAKPAGSDLLSRLSTQAKRIAKPAGFAPSAPRPAPARPPGRPALAPQSDINDEDVPF